MAAHRSTKPGVAGSTPAWFEFIFFCFVFNSSVKGERTSSFNGLQKMREHSSLLMQRLETENIFCLIGLDTQRQAAAKRIQ